ncbi:MAG TPA: hypothetical protein VM940_02035 [Chthoniobacterales bacterium]|nr:hypothetical protein [Chthoniobacterales bacterium]
MMEATQQSPPPRLIKKTQPVPPTPAEPPDFVARSCWILPALVFLAAAINVFAIAAYKKSGAFQDEGIVLVYPELILKGALPYRDFETFYGPGNLYVLAAAYRLFGVSILVERMVGLSYYVAILAAVFHFAGRWGMILGIGTSVMVGYLLLPLELGALAWQGAVAFGLWSLIVATSGLEPKRHFLAGLLAGLALLYRPDIGPAMIVSAGLLLFFRPAKSVGLFAAGAAVGLIPLFVITSMAGLTNVLNNLFIYPVLHVNQGRKLPLFGASPDLVALFFLHLGAALLAVAAALFMTRKKKA